MTTVIDHAIAIPTRPANVWDVIRDISNNPTWHPDCQRIQFLTTMKNGRGTRWRNTTKSNKEQVMEITAWYEGLGYEYRIVDGSNYPQNRGRIRLQESPEGTVVQWTFSYDIDGFWGNIRNRFGMKGHVDKLVVQGLRNLYTTLKDLKIDDLINPEDSKAYLKEAPNVEERASYQPRYPSKVKSQEIPIVKFDADAPFKPPVSEPLQSISPIPMIDEPPLIEEDTRPNPSIQPVNEQTIHADEPDFLKTIPDHAPVEPAPTLENTVADKVATQSTDTQESKSVTEHSGKATIEPLIPENDISKLDTSKISVFELFGIDKPSETENVKTLPTDSVEAKLSILDPIYEPPRSFMDSAPILPDIQPEVLERRRGLRAALRRRITKVRVPNLNK